MMTTSEELGHPVGEVLDLVDPAYRKIPAASQSGLRTMALEGPYYYHARHVAKTVEDKDTEAKKLGRAAHLAFETGTDIRDLYVIRPERFTDADLCNQVNAELEDSGSKAKQCSLKEVISTRSPSHRRYVELFNEKQIEQGKEVLTEDQAVRIEEAVKAVYDNPACVEKLEEGGQAEASIIQQDAKTGLFLKARTDLLTPYRNIDFKFQKERNIDRWSNAVRKDGGIYQSEFYTRLFERDLFTWIVISNTSPMEAYCVTVTREELLDSKSRVADVIDWKSKETRSIASANDAMIERLYGCYSMDDWHGDGWGVELMMGHEGWGR